MMEQMAENLSMPPQQEQPVEPVQDNGLTKREEMIKKAESMGIFVAGKENAPRQQEMLIDLEKKINNDGLTDEEKIEWGRLGMIDKAGLIGAVEINKESATINPEGQLMSSQQKRLMELEKKFNNDEELSDEEKIERRRLEMIDKAGLIGAVVVNKEPTKFNPGGILISSQQKKLMDLQRKINNDGLTDEEKNEWRKLQALENKELIGAVVMTSNKEEMPENF